MIASFINWLIISPLYSWLLLFRRQQIWATVLLLNFNFQNNDQVNKPPLIPWCLNVIASAVWLTWCRCKAGRWGSMTSGRKHGGRGPGKPPQPRWAAVPSQTCTSWRTRSLPAWPAGSSTGSTGYLEKEVGARRKKKSGFMTKYVRCSKLVLKLSESNEWTTELQVETHDELMNYTYFLSCFVLLLVSRVCKNL